MTTKHAPYNVFLLSLINSTTTIERTIFKTKLFKNTNGALTECFSPEPMLMDVPWTSPGVDLWKKWGSMKVRSYGSEWWSLNAPKKLEHYITTVFFFWKHSSISDVVWDIGWPRPLVVLFLLERLNVKRRPASGVNPSETTKIYSFDLPTSSHLGSPEWALWPHPPREQSPGSLIHLLRWSAAHRSSADGWTSPWWWHRRPARGCEGRRP